uniref:Uncharacterized protein MANES_06G003700 n=1 Tax=Rhizophora mucronata TaxID=61149 RepID=A0A2P2QSY8_RHIMU
MLSPASSLQISLPALLSGTSICREIAYPAKSRSSCSILATSCALILVKTTSLARSLPALIT